MGPAPGSHAIDAIANAALRQILDSGLCQHPSGAISASAALGPQPPRL